MKTQVKNIAIFNTPLPMSSQTCLNAKNTWLFDESKICFQANYFVFQRKGTLQSYIIFAGFSLLSCEMEYHFQFKKIYKDKS